MSLTFQLPRRLELKLAKLADAREERDRLNARIAGYERELCCFGFNAVIGQADRLGRLPAGPFVLHSDDLQATYVLHDSCTPAVSDEIAAGLDQADIPLSTVSGKIEVATLAPQACDRPKAVEAVAQAARAGITAQQKPLGKYFSSSELGELVQVNAGVHLKQGRLARRLPALIEFLDEEKTDAIALEVEALRVTQFLRIQA